MNKKKIIFLNNHFQKSDGTVRALIGLVNNLDPDKFDITIRSIYRCDRSLKEELRPGIKLESTFGFYFKGLSTIARHLPIKWLYNWCIGGKYDIEVAFQCDVPTLIVGHSLNPKSVHVAWMHGYGLHPVEFRNCDKVVCVSKYCADKAYKEMNGDIDVTYRYNVVNDEVIRQKAKEKIQLNIPAKPLFVSVGRLSPEKGYLRLVDILFDLRKEGYNFHFWLIGDGPERETISERIKEKGMQNCIIMLGSDPNPHKYTTKADAFICSSYNEGYSTACTEAALLGIPIITTDVPGGKEIIDDCECGMLTDKEDSSLKAGIKKVLDNPEILVDWKKTLERTSNKFTLMERKKQMTALFDEFLQKIENK